MNSRKKSIEELEAELPRKFAAAAKRAYRKALAAGLDVVITDGGVMYRISPDGTRKAIKKVKSRIPVKRGLKISVK